MILEEGNLPHPCFPYVWHAGAVEVPEWDAPANGTMHSGSGAEETSFSGGIGEGGHLQSFQSLWDTPVDGDLLQIPRAGDLGDI